MSNPTATKPSTCEKLASDPLATAMKCFVPCHEGSGAPRDVWNNVVPNTYSGAGGTSGIGGGQVGVGCGVGRYPTWVASGFNSSPTLKFGHNGPALAYPSCSWSSAQTKRTLFIVFRTPANFTFPFGTSGGQPFVLMSAGANGGDHGLCLSSLSQTTAALGLIRSNQVINPSSGLTLTAGTWYAVAVSSDDTTNPRNRLWQCYDYNAQAPLTNSGTVSTDGTTSLSVSNSPSATVMSYGIAGATTFPLEVYCFGLHGDYWDTTSNNLFPAFYADPVAAARGTYTASGTFAAGTAAVTEATTTTVGVSATRTTGIGTGGTGAPSYQWYRSQLSGDTPGSGTCPAITGATGLSYTDTPPSQGVVYFYYLQATDGSSTVTYPQAFSPLKDYAPIKLGIVGDSIWLGAAGDVARYPYFVRDLAARNRSVTAVNTGVFGSSAASGTATLSWAPATGNLIAPAMNSFAAEGGITWVVVTLGANDVAGSKTAAQYQTDLTAVVNTLVSNGYKCILEYPTYAGSKTGAQNDLLRQYQGAINAIAAGNPANVVVGDQVNWRWSAANQRDFADGLHPTGGMGGSSMGFNTSRSVENVFGPGAPSTTERVRNRLGDP